MTGPGWPCPRRDLTWRATTEQQLGGWSGGKRGCALATRTCLEHDHGRVMDCWKVQGRSELAVTHTYTHTVAILTSERNECVCRTARVDHVAFCGLLPAHGRSSRVMIRSSLGALLVGRLSIIRSGDAGW